MKSMHHELRESRYVEAKNLVTAAWMHAEFSKLYRMVNCAMVEWAIFTVQMTCPTETHIFEF